MNKWKDVASATRYKISRAPLFIRNHDDAPKYTVHENLRVRRIIEGVELPGGGPHTLLFAGYNTCPPGKASLNHWHHNEELWYIDKGTGWWYDAFQEPRPIKGGTFIYVPPDAPHEFAAADEAISVWCVGSQILERSMPRFWSSHFEHAEKVTQTPAGFLDDTLEEVLGYTIRPLNAIPCEIVHTDDVEVDIVDDGVLERTIMGTGLSGRKGPIKVIDIVLFTFNTLLPGSTLKEHWHYYEEFLYVVNGKGVLSDGREKKEVQTGDTIYVAPNVPHGLSALEKMEVLSLGARLPDGRPDMETRYFRL